MVLPDVGISFGWLLIIGGALLLLVEVHSPGFFATVPATVMIILGILQLVGVDISNPWMGGILGIGYSDLCCRFHGLDVREDHHRMKARPRSAAIHLLAWKGR